MESATQMLKRAVELDSNKKYSEAKVCYEEGLEMLLKMLPAVTEEALKNQIRIKVSAYMKRAEELKEFIAKNKSDGKFHERIEIKDSQRGCSYCNLFSKYIDANLTSVFINDAYIRSHHQIFNLLRFCELLVKKAKNLKSLKVLTGQDENNCVEQRKKLEELSASLKAYGVTMAVEFSSTIHDREIGFDNGWIIKIGRGLDYFKPPKGRISLGFCDMDLRECHETIIDVYNTN
ncbi:MIT domain-containing protein 1 [Hydra vulgaris]|uniref:MIT domain-containing protein 1 n=1 Tax=Hydra vulgaris TaxID=6087 RepID=A0ABM4CSS0_HYDVU